MNRRRCLLLALASLAPLPAGAQSDVVAQFLQRYIQPKAAAGPEKLHLLYLRKADPQAIPESCYRELTPGRGWSKEKLLSGGYLSVAFYLGGFYVFRRDNYSVYRGADFVSRKWPFEWPPAAACLVGDTLWVFGPERVGKAHRIRAARFTRGTGAEAGGSPTLVEAALAVPSPAHDVSAAPQGARPLVFWHQDLPEGEAGNEVWHAPFDGESWGEAERVAAPYGNSDFAVAGYDGAVWLFCRERGHRLTERRPLLYTILAKGVWSRPATVPDAVDPMLDYTFDLDAVAFEGSLYLFRATMSNLVTQTWTNGAWGEPEKLFEEPAWATYRMWWWVINVVACVVLLPVVVLTAFRMRGKSRRIPLPSGAALRAATWSRRAIALLLDFLMVEGLYRAGEILFAPGSGIEDGGSLPVAVALRLAVFFAYFVATEGLMAQSLGKWALSIEVVGPDGRRPSVGRVVVRNLFRPWFPFFPAAYLVGSIVLLLAPRNQRLGDLAAHTFVVDIPPRKREPVDSWDA